MENKVPPNVPWNKVDNANPLHFAVISNNEKLVELLLQKGSDPNHKDVQGNTPYHIASLEPSLEICKLLEKYNGDATIQNLSGEIPLETILKHKEPKITEFYLSIQKYKKFIDKI